MAFTQQILHIINRTTKPLDVMDDGRPYTIPPGYIVVPDIDPETKEQRLKREKIDGKPVEIPMVKVVPAGEPDAAGVQTESPTGKPYKYPMLAGAAIRARRQHILRGSQDPDQPQVAETLCACVEIDDPYDHQEQAGEDVELIDVSLLPEERRKARQRIVNPHHLSKERRRSLVDPRLTNITGLRMDY